MAPTRGAKSGGGRGGAKSGGKSGGSGSSKSLPRGVSKTKSKPKPAAPAKTTSERKTKPLSHRPEKKKKRVYTEKELNIPALNGIRPAGVTKAKGQKKGKVFVDDSEGMMAILAMVQAEKEGDIESKIQKARKMEELREAKRAEAEKREGERREKLEGVKDEIRKKKGDKKRRAKEDATSVIAAQEKTSKKKKSVSFG